MVNKSNINKTDYIKERFYKLNGFTRRDAINGLLKVSNDLLKNIEKIPILLKEKFKKGSCGLYDPEGNLGYTTHFKDTDDPYTAFFYISYSYIVN